MSGPSQGNISHQDFERVRCRKELTLLPPGMTRVRPRFFSPTEMRDGAGHDLAPGALLLRPMREHVRRRRLPREGREAVLPRRLLQHVRAQVWRLQRAHHGQLHLRPQRTVAPGVLRLQGKYRPFSSLPSCPPSSPPLTTSHYYCLLCYRPFFHAISMSLPLPSSVVFRLAISLWPEQGKSSSKYADLGIIFSISHFVTFYSCTLPTAT